jgi:3-dehydroquinate synthase
MKYCNHSYKKTKIKSYAKLSDLKVDEDSLLIVDRNLLKNRFVSSFLKKFTAVYKVDAGESLKDFSKMPIHLRTILNLTKNIVKKNLIIYSMGGGSTTDFAGFVASIIHRGVSVVHFPSTWISAVDSAHGGKTAMNLLGYKNQVGTFWYAQKVLLCRELLLTQEEELFKDSFGELLKVGFLDGEDLFQKICRIKDSRDVFPLMNKLVNSKYKVLQKDPFEKNGYRKILNLGHTVGHAYEAKFGIPHGKAVLLGMHFAIWLSSHLKLMPEAYSRKTMKVLAAHLNKNELTKYASGLASSLIKFISFDKKMNSKNSISFVLAKKAGDAFFQDIKLNDLDKYFKFYHHQLVSNELFL